MGDSTKVQMGTCSISYGSSDLGFTKGATSCSFSTESVEITVDQLDTPVDEIITKQTFEVKVPMAEYDLTRLASLLPSAVLTTESTKLRLDLTGSAGGSLLANAQELILAPAGGTANDAVILHHAIPLPNMEFAYEKENQRVFEVTFKALAGENGWVTLGDKTVVV